MTSSRPHASGPKGGRPRKGKDLRREVWLARHSARSVLHALQKPGPHPAVMSQQELGRFAQLGKEELARMAEWFPAAVDTSAKAHYWDLGILHSILIWDDPVVMLQRLLPADQQWWSALKDAENEPCSFAQEEAIRNAAHLLRLAGPTVPDDPMVLVHFKRFQENTLQRLK